jgi:hypothetical protein
MATWSYAPVLVVRPDGSIFRTFADFELEILPNGGARCIIRSIDKAN